MNSPTDFKDLICMSNGCSIGILMRMSAFHYMFSFQQLQWSSISITGDKLGTKKDVIFFSDKAKIC